MDSWGKGVAEGCKQGVVQSKGTTAFKSFFKAQPGIICIRIICSVLAKATDPPQMCWIRISAEEPWNQQCRKQGGQHEDTLLYVSYNPSTISEILGTHGLTQESSLPGAQQE